MPYINLKTEIPGPKAKIVLERRARAVSSGVARATDVVVERARGALVEDVDGNTFIDFAGGIGMLAVGHCPENVTRAMNEQASKLIHMCALVATYEPYVRLAELLNSAAPGSFPKKTVLANSGAEAVENAVKLSRAFTGRQAIVVFEGAYHGRTLLTLSLTSKYNLFKKGFGPFAPEIYRFGAPNVYRRPESLTETQYLDECLRQLDKSFVAQVDPSAVAAVLIEPVQGEAGFLPVPAPFLHRLRELCDKHGMLFIADEIQCGMGRTGKLFAIEHYGIAPDLITTAKSLGAGMPISAVTGRADVLDAAHTGGVGGTYGGNPVACAAAIEAIETIRKPEFLARAAEIGKLLERRLAAWRERFPIVGDARGLGPMQLIEFVRDRRTKEPAPEETLATIRRAAAKGLILIRAGLYSNCIRLMPPLMADDVLYHEGLDVLEGAIIDQVAQMPKPTEAIAKT
ncbi:MAG TPA: aspartate aminotransferase family protein [Vicinamibacteria bacterium]|nr:aspartate aminotransferase family protein [Vicinamibacteria bacterium]